MRSAHPSSNPPGRAFTNPRRGIPSPRGGGKLHRWDFRYMLAFSSKLPNAHMCDLDGKPVSISQTNLPQMTEDTSSGQSSPIEPAPSQKIVESECSDGIDITQATSRDLSRASSYNPSNPYSPAMHLASNTRYQSVGPSTDMSTSPLESRPKNESLSAGAHLIDQTCPVSIEHYPYPGVSGIPPTQMQFYGNPNLSPNAGVPITHTSTENLSTETMMPYGHPYYFNY